MTPKRPTGGPRPQQGKKSQYWYRHPYYCPPYYHDWYDYDYDYDWYDYDYDWYDYEYLAPSNKPKRPMPPRGPARNAEYSDESPSYQQGFKDGWKAAMDYMMYGMEPVEPTPPPAPMPMPPQPRPAEGVE